MGSMNSIVLSERLERIASFVPNGKKLADIGSDHALLPTYLVKRQVVPSAIAGEVNEGPLLAAQKQVKEAGLLDRVSVRKGNGLEVLQQGEVDVITIAGMGGALIRQILNEGVEKLHSVERLILQPNVGEDLVREWLDQQNWTIIEEDILEENEKIYEIIVAEPRTKEINDPYHDQNWTKQELYRLGPILCKKESPIQLKKWQRELDKIEYILNQLESIEDQSEKEMKTAEYRAQRKWIMGVITCLQKDKPSFNS